MILAHRVSWELRHKKPIPDDLCVLHKCDNRKCVNPKHLFLGTNADNSADMVRKGRSPVQIGERNSNCKLKEADVVLIRQLANGQKTQRAIAKQFSVSEMTISEIVTRKRWTHV